MAVKLVKLSLVTTNGVTTIKIMEIVFVTMETGNMQIIVKCSKLNETLY